MLYFGLFLVLLLALRVSILQDGWLTQHALAFIKRLPVIKEQ
jgi:hypothetical protein